jgi:hypothetical protein
MKAKVKKKPNLPTLEERLASFQKENGVIAKFVDERARCCPGVPRGVVEYTLTGRAGTCKCEALQLIRKASGKI